MCKFVYRPIVVLCEGLSEEAYIQSLNKFFHSQENNKITFIPKIIEGVTSVNRRIKRFKKENNNAKYVVWLDGDVFKREERLPPKNLKDKLLLNTFSFEDFLVMHLDRNMVIKWQGICEKQGHFSKPITSKACERNIGKIFQNYKKGSMPDEVIISEESLKNLFDNQEDDKISFYSDFADYLKKLRHEK